MIPFRAPAVLSSSPPEEAYLKAPANSRSSPHSEPLYCLPPPLEVALARFPSPGLQDGSRSSNQQVRGSIHVYRLGSFRFKGMANAKSMVYVLQDKLASRAAKFAPKSVNPALATLVPQQQPEGVTKSTYLVPLPVVDVDLALGLQDRSARAGNVRFELDSQHDSDRLVKMSEPSGKGTLSVQSQDIVPSPH
ncbi:hypothetical protein DUNSADRAFT_17320 [Dunaliella salina]|uniref:Encoded protein n=1 Tax=Dunaliella salina TaxID=3046 RepID=A0ABQ7G1X3_DUNSA|nr:hypothetical protein DUNSADRAFT_17320 [Dunaliella salina]|eukprot:KAF5828607.1 hypothetical protein DUNSADRAFT_17320 [Dunaliella salina]